MKFKLCDINSAALDKLPQHTGDKSGIGVHYIDAYLKPMNVKLEDGTRIKCKRRGLKISLAVGDKKGDGLMRRVALGPDPVVMLDAALAEAAKAAEVEISAVDGACIWYANEGISAPLNGKWLAIFRRRRLKWPDATNLSVGASSNRGSDSWRCIARRDCARKTVRREFGSYQCYRASQHARLFAVGPEASHRIAAS